MSEPLPLPPFKAFLASNIPSVYDNTLSYYDELTKLIGYLEQVVVPAVDATASEVDGIKKGLEELKSYVDHYFENLDVQEEINNKLDDMAERGQLATIIDQFVNLGVLFTYDTLADMVAAENLIAGCTCRTLGKETINDGCGAIYKIAAEGDIELDSGLYATLYDNTEGNNYYDEITVVTGRTNDTDYRVATIPLNDTDGNMIPCYVDEVPDHTLSPLQYADANYTTLTMNAGLGRQDSQSQWKQGAVIANGVILHGDLCDVTIPEWYSYLGIKADRSVKNYDGDTTPEAMLTDGVQNAFLTFGTIVTNGAVDVPEHWSGDDLNPWMMFGVKADGSYIIMSSDGRTRRDKGMTVTQAAGLMVTLGCVTAWKCDAGGSSSLVYKGSKQNRNIDDNGTTDRGIWVTLNFKKETNNEQLAKAYSFIGEERQLLNKQIRDDITAKYDSKKAFIGLDMRSTGFNNITDADTTVAMKFEHYYTHNNDQFGVANERVFEMVTDAAGKITSVKFNRTGMFRVTFSIDVYCTSTAGQRWFGVGINNSTDAASTYAQNWDYIVPTASNQRHLMASSFVLNNTTAGNPIYLLCKGQVGDDFNRVMVQIEELGTTNN